MKVLKIVEGDVSDKIDTSYVWEQLNHIDKVALIFICTLDEQEEDDWYDENGRHIIILLPYKEVKLLTDARPLMLAKAKERLGLVA
jgi:hypothetical protein